MREYQKTHKWLSFKFDTSNLSSNCWMLLGEAKAGCEKIADVPLQPQIAQQLMSISISKGAHATAAIEGNTLSEDEVLKRLQGKLVLPPSQEQLGKEIDNVAHVYNKIKEDVLSANSRELTVDDMTTFNELFLCDLALEKGVIPGNIRNYGVGVRKYLGAPWKDCSYLLKCLCDWVNDEGSWPQELHFNLIKAIVAHVYVAWIHPFGDGNGRTARAVELKLLLSSGVPAIASHLLNTHYNQLRNEYYRQLDYTSESGGELSSFIEFALRGFVDNLNQEFEVIREQHLKITWRNYVYDFFKEHNSGVYSRRRKLVLDLSDFDEPQSIQRIRRISPRMAELYSDKTDMTIRRDVHFLAARQLIKMAENGKYFANKALVKAFLPDKVDCLNSAPVPE